MKNTENRDHFEDDSLENAKKKSEKESKEGEAVKPDSPKADPSGSDPAIVESESPEKADSSTGKPTEDTAPFEATEDQASTSKEPAEDKPPLVSSEEKSPTQDKATEDITAVEDTEDKASTTEKPTEDQASKPESTAKDQASSPEEIAEDQASSSEKTTEDQASTPGKPAEDLTSNKEKPNEEKPPDQDEAEEEKINFELLSKEDLVQLLEEDLSKKPFEVVKDYVDEIRSIFTKKHDKEVEEKRAKFIAEGGIEEDFKPFDDPATRKMEELLDKVKSLKADYNKQQEQTKEANLAEKQEILEEFRLLMEGQESFDNTFRKFKQLQKRWFDSGFVPQQNVKDLWNSYNYFVDKFNDYVKINRELRALDLKKNLEFKLGLCEKVEELTKEEDVVLAFKTLQKYHAQWRETGPVPREEKDVIWERFKAATAIINKAHQSHQSELRVSLVENLEKKEKLCEKVEEIAAHKFASHKEWSEKTQEILAIQKEWKTIGYAPKKDNNLIYARFRKACDTFFGLKAEFYAETFEQQKDNLKEKEEIVAEAEALKESTDWKDTTNKLIGLQKKWKEIGPVPRRESDRLWKKFRAACDHFFEQKSEFYSDIDSSYSENLKAKLDLIEEVKKYKAPKDRSELNKDLDEFHKRYSEIGFVPVDKKEEIRESFRYAISNIIASLDIDEQAKSLLGFRSRMLGIIRSPKADTKLNYEREKLHNKLQQLKNDISVWENNIGFIKQTESSEDTISGYQEKLDDARSRIELLEKKIKLLDRLESEL